MSELVAEGKVSQERVCEDYHANSIDNIPDVDRSPFFETLVKELLDGRDCAVADILFCHSERLESLVRTVRAYVSDVAIDPIYFRNDAAACRDNVLRTPRGDELARLARIEELTRIYLVPEHAAPREVFPRASP